MILAATKRIYIRFVQYLQLQLLPAFGIALFVVKNFFGSKMSGNCEIPDFGSPKSHQILQGFHRSARVEPDSGKQMLILSILVKFWDYQNSMILGARRVILAPRKHSISLV